MLQNMKQRFEEIDHTDSFHRVDETHILDLYIGRDSMGRDTLFLISETAPPRMFSSQTINVQVGARQDKKWGISFSLVNNKYEDIFCHFCNDIIESSRAIGEKATGAEFICLRYIKWQQMLKKNNSGLLTQAEIKGLIGELYFLNHFLIPWYGEEIAVNSWIGPEKADQDFVCENTWYEIKSTVSGAESICISSVEQLDMPLDGELVIIYLDKTSHANELRVTLNSIYQETIDGLSSELLKQKLSEILLNLGYFKRNEYDEYIYRFSGMGRYHVGVDFPSLRRTAVPAALVNAKYDLSIAFISRFLREE